MRRYELMVILLDTLEEDAVEGVLQRIRDVVDQQSGRVVDESYWGKRQLTYEIDHRRYGYYAVFDIELGQPGIEELTRQLDLSDDVVRYKALRPDLRVRRPA